MRFTDLKLIDMDLHGPIKIETLGGSMEALLAEYSRVMWVDMLKR